MYLSRLTLNPQNPRVQRELAAPYELYRSILGAFPKAALEPTSILFRIDKHSRLDAPVLLVQSDHCPDWNRAQTEPPENGYLLPIGEPNPGVKSFNVEAQAGQVMVFRLRARPAQRKTTEGGREFQIGVHDSVTQQAWLKRKAKEAGFELLHCDIYPENSLGGRLWNQGIVQSLNFVAVRFEGILEVTDPEPFSNALRQGIGGGKTLGFGLLSLAPVEITRKL